ncbi:MAG: hypothetical protein ABIR66_07755 [Saprospiraceae bacterium]
MSYDIIKAHGGTIEVKSFSGPPGGSINVTSNYLSALPTGKTTGQSGDKQDREPCEISMESKDQEGTEFCIVLPE